MIVYDFDVERVPIGPSEADPPSIVDTNAVPALPVTFQSLKSVAGRNSQVLQNSNPVKIQQLPSRRPLKGLESNHWPVVKELLCVFVFEGLDHYGSIVRVA